MSSLSAFIRRQRDMFADVKSPPPSATSLAAFIQKQRAEMQGQAAVASPAAQSNSDCDAKSVPVRSPISRPSRVVLNAHAQLVIDELDFPDMLDTDRSFDAIVGSGPADPELALHTRDLLAAARQSLDAGNTLSTSQLAKLADKPRTTLTRWIRALSERGEAPRRGRPPLLKYREERTLVGLALTRQALNAPFNKLTLGHMARLILSRRRKRFDTPSGQPGPDWWDGFLKRWPVLSVRQSSRVSAEALTRATRENLEPWFERVKAVQARVPDGGRWLCMDETHARPAPEADKVLVARGTKYVHAESVSYTAHVTVVPTVTARGDMLPTLFVFPGKTVNEHILNGGPLNAAVGVTDSGWMTCRLFVLYLQWIEQYMPPHSPDNPVVLLVDQHESRFSEEALDFCAERGIILLALPSQLTSLLMPLDLAVYRPFKSKLAKVFASSATTVNRLNFVSLITPALLESFSRDNILSGWRKAGLFPFDPDSVLNAPAVRQAELRAEVQQHAALAMAEPAAASSSSSSSSSPNSSLALVAADASEAAPSKQQDGLASSERLSLLQLSHRVAPIYSQPKRTRKSRGLLSGAVLTDDDVRAKIAADRPAESKASLNALLWSPGDPLPSHARKQAQQQSDSDDSDSDGEWRPKPKRARRSAAAKVRRARVKPVNEPQLDSEGDQRMPDAQPSKARATHSAASRASNSNSAPLASPVSRKRRSALIDNSSEHDRPPQAAEDAMSDVAEEAAVRDRIVFESGAVCESCAEELLESDSCCQCTVCTLIHHTACAGWHGGSSSRPRPFVCERCKAARRMKGDSVRAAKRARRDPPSAADDV